jgi:hypothetical protein
MVDFAHLKDDDEAYLLSMIEVAHRHNRLQLFEHLVQSPHFLPEQFMSELETNRRVGCMNASNLGDFIGLLEHVVAVNANIIGDRVFSAMASSVLGNSRMSDAEMAGLLSRLYDLGATFDAGAAEMLQKYQPDFAQSRQFVTERLADVKEPID